MAKERNFIIMAVVFVVGMVALAMILGGNQEASTTGTIKTDDDGNSVGIWDGKVVNYKLIVSDAFTGDNVETLFKVYDKEPKDWEDTRGKFDDPSEYTAYTATALAGNVVIDEETPGLYYVVATATGYNMEFFTMEIPDGSKEGGVSLPDYQSNPSTSVVKMAQLGSTTDEDFALTLVNDSTAELSESVILKVDENTEFRGWKVVVTDEEGFSYDTDNDGTYDEGITSYVVIVNGEEFTIFDSTKGIDEFDSNDKATFEDITGLVVANKGKVIIDIEIEGATGDYVGANDEVWGEGEGVLSYIYIYDAYGNLFSTTNVEA